MEENKKKIKPVRTRGIYILLAIFIGTFGVHNFYIGRLSRGGWQVGVFLISFLAMEAGQDIGAFGVMGVVIWVITDIVNIHTDGDGEALQ